MTDSTNNFPTADIPTRDFEADDDSDGFQISEANMHFYEGIDMPAIGPQREGAWAEIADAGDERTATRVPRLLDDAWDRSKRSREYLNALEHDLDAKYYNCALVA